MGGWATAEKEERKNKNKKIPRPSLRLLSFVTSVISALPLKRAEEACIVIQETSGICASHSDSVLVELQALLREADAGDDDARAGPAGPSRAGSSLSKSLIYTSQAAAALCMLHRLRNRIERAYNISPERAAAFAAAGKRKTSEESIAAVLDSSVPAIQVVDLEVGIDVDVSKAGELYEELEVNHAGSAEAD